MSYDKIVSFSDLIGKTFTKVEQVDEAIHFVTEEGSYILRHEPECCESVNLVDVAGNLGDLVDLPVLSAEESFKYSGDDEDDKGYSSQTWSFYRVTTFAGTVVIQFHGESNGYYNETATFSFSPKAKQT